MSYVKTIVVIGGTGMYGGSVAHSLKDNAEFQVLLTTRDPNSPKARQRREEGFLLVKADSWSAAELDSAFANAYGVFLNTDSDDANFKNEIGAPESAMGKIVIDAAIRQGVKYFVYSGLPQCERLTNGEVSILSFSNKNAIANYGRKAGFEAFVEVNAGWAMDIFFMETYGKAFGGFATIPDAEGFLSLKTFSMGNDPERIPWSSVKDDYGDAVHAVFLDPAKYADRIIWAISEAVGFQHVVDTYNRITGTQVARFVPQTEPLKAATPGKTKEVNGLRNYCHYMKGDYCNGQVTDDRLLEEMRTLKALASKARGKGHASTQTIEGFLRENSSVKARPSL
ncbi:NAD(P)-binding protein [Aspergillus campestris IBT 28561]|uniref:NAD(P)-binding protein n=1 Tax=Aspergillus campestris (strain IBT 28561) TaxID=1392248 RepID=A0A2I1CXW9_ASPC2|nr:NAD(P)-binding protein [Aspergillus campestris IBT 28561]PKY02457.1 NAD(P)-binding protein [Aspergillus campestris IBT 28561]